MKKAVLILFIASLLILNIFSIALIHAADLVNINPDTGEADILGINPETIPKTPEDAKTIAKNYLLKEWGKDLRNENSSIGKFTSPIFKAYDKISPYTDPVFKIVLGITPEFSWLFILTFAIWITFLVYMYRILSIFSTFSKIVSFIISLAMVTIMSVMKLPIIFANYLIYLISTLTGFWMQLIAVVLIITLAILASIFSKEFEALMKKWKENRKKMKIESEIEELKAQGKSQAEIQKMITDTFGEIGDAMDE